MPRITTPGRQHFDRNGNPLSNGQLYTRETDAATDKAVYPTEADATAGTNALSNPVILDSEGREPEMFGGGNYWMNLEDSDGVQVPGWPKAPVSVLANSSPQNLFYGLELSNNSTDAAHDIDVTIGACVAAADSVLITIASSLIKQIDATWAAGTNAGGLASGASLTADTWFHVFAVISGGAADVMLDSSPSCANGVSNNSVTSYQYINSVLTDSSSNILAFKNDHNLMWLDVPINSENRSAPGSGARSVILSTPSAFETVAEIAATSTTTSGIGYVLIVGGSQTATLPTSTIYDIGSSGATLSSINKRVLTDTSSTIKYRCSSGASGNIVITTIGWEILR